MTEKRRASDSDRWIMRHLELVKWLAAIIFAGGIFYEHQRGVESRVDVIEQRLNYFFGQAAAK